MDRRPSPLWWSIITRIQAARRLAIVIFVAYTPDPPDRMGQRPYSNVEFANVRREGGGALQNDPVRKVIRGGVYFAAKIIRIRRQVDFERFSDKSIVIDTGFRTS